MKTSYLLIALLFTGSLFLGAAANAQISKGSVFLGGAIGYSDNSNKSDNPNTPGNTNFTTTTLTFSPSYSWAVKNGMVLGLDLNYGYQKIVQPFYTTMKLNSYGAGIFLRNYKYLGSRFSIFGQTAFSLGYSSANTDYDPAYSTGHQDMKGFGTGLKFFPGVAYQISPHWLIEADFPSVLYVSYNHSKETDQTTNAPDTHYTTNNFSIGSNLTNTFTLAIGLFYVIGKS